MLNDGIQVQEIEECLLCKTKGVPLYQGLRDRLFDAPGLWSLLRCPRDGLVWLNPQPTLNDIRRVYTTSYITHTMPEGQPQPWSAPLRRAVKRALLATAFEYRELLYGQLALWLGRVAGLFFPCKEIVGAGTMYLKGTERGKLIDVGCGNGVFLATMRDLGWDVLGLEPDPQAASIARGNFGLPVILGTLEEAGLPDGYFDAVTMGHVIEHVHDPVALLWECRRVLKPGGKLVVTMPNSGSLGHRVFKKAWYALDPPRHLNLFSPRTLRACAEQAGLQIETLSTLARSAGWIWYYSRSIRRDGVLPDGSPKSISWWLRMEGQAFQLIDHWLHLFWKDLGEEVLMIAAKGKSDDGN